VSNYLSQVNLEYRWVLIPKVLEFSAPEFWHSKLSRVVENKEELTKVRLVKELEHHIILIEANSDSNDSALWHFKGWVLKNISKNESHLKYEDIALECEVIIASNAPLLSSTHKLPSPISSDSLDPINFLTDDALDAEYTLGLLLEAHSRATYLKHLMSSIIETIPDCKIDTVREDLRNITVFGNAFGGQWSMELDEDPVKNLYDAEFTFWRKGSSGVKTNFRENNPTIIAEENQYFSGAVIRDPRLLHLSNSIKDALSKYS
jgi:hypothetical protein